MFFWLPLPQPNVTVAYLVRFYVGFLVQGFSRIIRGWIQFQMQSLHNLGDRSLESSGSFPEGLPLSSGGTVVFWPGGFEPSSLSRGFGPALCLSLGLSSRRGWVGGEGAHFSLRWSLHEELRGRGSCPGKPPTSQVPALCPFTLGGWWQEPVSPESLSQWELYTGILRNWSGNWYARGNVPSTLATLNHTVCLDNQVTCKYR